jgi:hypothetical protein
MNDGTYYDEDEYLEMELIWDIWNKTRELSDLRDRQAVKSFPKLAQLLKEQGVL